MNIDVNVKVTLDLSPLFVDMLWNVLVRLPSTRQEDLDQRIEASVSRAVPQPAAASGIVAPVPPIETEPEAASLPVVPVELPPARDEGKRWTVERSALLKSEYPVSTDLRELYRKLSALPGASFTYEQMRWTANSRGLAQSARAWRRTAGAPPVEPVPVVSVAAASAPADIEASSTQTRWTEERCAILAFYYPAGDPLPKILKLLNALPGPAVSEEQMKAKIISSNLKRSVPPEIAAPAVRAPAEPAAGTDDATIRHWAGARGLCNGGEPIDLVRINRKRMDLGLAPFVRAIAGKMQPRGAA